MVKMIGMLLIASSLLLMIATTFIDLNYRSNEHITGNVISTILEQPDVHAGFFDYAEGIALSYSIISLIMGIVFLFRV
ncbi:hypothetical protein HYY70_03100 [Candidatus Woesearchaeota archaeon]|nr:hypothetical protein [Candidatus Woesearchaeota archaeon]